MAFIDDGEEVVREVVYEALARRTRGASRERPRVILDAVAVAELAHHLDVVFGAFAKPLRLEELPLGREELKPFVKLGLDALERRLETILAHHKLLRGRNDDGRHRDATLAREWIQLPYRIDVIAKKLDANRLRLVRREDVQDVAPHPERPRLEVKVIPRILRLNELGDDPTSSSTSTSDLDLDRKVPILIALPQSVDAAHGRYDDHVLPCDERICRGKAVTLDFLVDGRVLLDVGIGLGDVGFGLVVVVVGDEVLDGVFGKEFLQLGEELRGERLVVAQNQRRTIPLGD